MKTSLALVLLLAGFAPAAAQDCHDAPQDAQQQAAAAPAPEPEKPETEKLGALNVPDVPVIDQDGKAKNFYTDLVKDRVVAVNFVFTTCRTICPPMGATFGKLQQVLGERAGKDVHLISVSVDPGTDTPERLKAWSQKFGAGQGWTLVTGDRAEITRLLKALGVYTANIGDHSPLVLIGNDARRQWTRAYGLAAPAKLAELIDGMAAPRSAAKGSQP
ncbi:MAG TPA: SCO family protein [Thermoanaerobaculia bacterium]|nr:SCO family protein [Thermoanaerobaculia bacterium]